MSQDTNESERDERERYEDWQTAQEGEELILPNDEVSLEELEEAEFGMPADVYDGDLRHTQDGDGSTDDPHQAQEQGLVYNPPTDPPVIPSDDGQNVEIAAGFANTVEDDGIEAYDLPDEVDDNDLDIEEDLYTALRINSETSTLEDIYLSVRDGIVFLAGTVPTEDDIAHVEHVVRSHEAVRDVRNGLESSV